MTATVLGEGIVKISIIFAIAMAANRLLRRRSAALRHWVLAAAFVSAAAAPALERIVPAWQLPILPGVSQARARPLAQPKPVDTPEPHNAPAPAASPDTASNGSAVSLLVRLWFVGAALGLLTLAAGLTRLAVVASSARPVVAGPWRSTVEACALEYGLSRSVRVLHSDHPSLLVTWGLFRPRILVPRHAQEWSAERIRIVVLHELAHIGRGDWAVQMLAEIVRAVNWFNPFVWVACHRLRDESEHAADDAVLNRGVDGAAYASELLALARTFVPQRHSWLPAPAIARSSSLERRVRAMLNARVNRRPATRAARASAAAALIGVAVAIASAQSVFSSFAGVIRDQTDGLLPNVKIVLTHTSSGAKYEVRSNAAGRFEFVGLQPGLYTFETELMGFQKLRGTLEIGGQNVERDVQLQVGSLEETVSVRANSPEPTTRASSRASRAVSCTAPQAADPGIGGNIRAPHKLVHVVPQYPASLAVLKQGGLVVLDALIGADGTIRELRTVSSTHPDFEIAAADAVRQWEFSQTLLNCLPVEVAMKVTVRFVAE